jgi:hypothetical protein
VVAPGRNRVADDLEDTIQQNTAGRRKAPVLLGCGEEQIGRCNFPRKDHGPSAKRHRWAGGVFGAAAQVLAETGEPLGRVFSPLVDLFPLFLAHGPTLRLVFR